LYSSGACVNCSAGQSSNGNGGSCTCCPSGYQSQSGGLCTPCPAGQVSNPCGLCVDCLPVAQYNGCPVSIFTGATCSRNACKFTSQNGQSVGVCDCELETTTAACDYLYGISLKFPADDNTAVFPYTSIVLFDTTPTNVADSAQSTIAVLFTEFSGISGTVSSEITSINTSDLLPGYVNPITTAPVGYKATQFGFYVISWTTSNNIVISQTVTPALSVFVPFDFLILEPSNLALFYYNTEISEWVLASFSCGIQYNTTIFGDQGVIEFPSLQATGQFWVFRQAVILPPNPIHGGFNPGGTTRIQTSTTQVTGIVPQPAPSSAPAAPVSQPQKFGAAASTTPSLLLLLFFILAIIF